MTKYRFCFEFIWTLKRVDYALVVAWEKLLVFTNNNNNNKFYYYRNCLDIQELISLEFLLFNQLFINAAF
jgi:hypothetical protein